MESQSPPIISNFDLYLEVGVLADILPGAYINKIQQIGAEIFKFKLSTPSGAKDMIVILGQTLYLTNYKYDAPMLPSNYSRFLRKRLSSEKIISIHQHNLDRVCYVETTNYYLIFELFAAGNIILTDKNWIIQSLFHPHKWKDRDLHPKEKYIFPAPVKYSIQNLSKADLTKILGSSKPINSLIKNTDLGPFYAELIYGRAKVKDTDSIYSSIRKLLDKLKAAKKIYVVNYKNGRALVPFMPPSPIKEFPDINTALDESFLPIFLANRQPTKQESKVATLVHRLQEQEASFEKFGAQATDYKEKGDLIYANYDKLQRILNALNHAKKNEAEWKALSAKLEKDLQITIKEVKPKASKVVLEI